MAGSDVFKSVGFYFRLHNIKTNIHFVRAGPETAHERCCLHRVKTSLDIVGGSLEAPVTFRNLLLSCTSSVLPAALPARGLLLSVVTKVIKRTLWGTAREVDEIGISPGNPIIVFIAPTHQASDNLRFPKHQSAISLNSTLSLYSVRAI